MLLAIQGAENIDFSIILRISLHWDVGNYYSGYSAKIQIKVRFKFIIIHIFIIHHFSLLSPHSTPGTPSTVDSNFVLSALSSPLLSSLSKGFPQTVSRTPHSQNQLLSASLSMVSPSPTINSLLCSELVKILFSHPPTNYSWQPVSHSLDQASAWKKN